VDPIDPNPAQALLHGAPDGAFAPVLFFGLPGTANLALRSTDLGGEDDTPSIDACQRLTDECLALAVHRGRVEEVHATVKRAPEERDDRVAIRILEEPDRRPAEPEGRNLEPGRAQYPARNHPRFL